MVLKILILYHKNPNVNTKTRNQWKQVGTCGKRMGKGKKRVETNGNGWKRVAARFHLFEAVACMLNIFYLHLKDRKYIPMDKRISGECTQIENGKIIKPL